MKRDGRPCYLYRLFDRDDVLLYVGISYNPRARLAGHTTARTARWHFVVRVSVERFSDRDRALVAERAAIRSEHPLYNVRHNVPVPEEMGPEERVAIATRLAAIRARDEARLARRKRTKVKSELYAMLRRTYE